MRRLALVTGVLLSATVQAGEAPGGPSPNLLRNATFTQCANPGVPDWWGTGAAEVYREWAGVYGTVPEAPLPGCHALRLVCPPGGSGIAVQSHAHSLPAEREYTFSVYLRTEPPGLPAVFRVGDQSRAVRPTDAWQRYSLTATPKTGHWAAGRLSVGFGLQAAGTLLIAAPQLEYGSTATPFRPADADSGVGAVASPAKPAPPRPAVPLPEAECAIAAAAPVIDGRLDEPCYRAAAPLAPFRDMETGAVSAVQTEGFLLRDADALYIAFRCHEPDMASVTARAREHDTAVFADDSVEIFLQPDPSSPDYLHLAVNAAGSRFDERQHDPSWNPAWRAAAERGAGVWTVEIAIPFSELGLTPRTAETWRVNLCRNRPRGTDKGYSQWSCSWEGYHVPARFGRVSGFRRRDLEAHFRRPAEPVPAPAPAAPALAAVFEFSYYTDDPTARLWVESALTQAARIECTVHQRVGGASIPLLPVSPGPGGTLVGAGGRRFIEFGLGGLPTGAYDAAVRALDAAGAELGSAAAELIRLAPAPIQVRMHRVNRSLWVNGKPLLVYAQGLHGGNREWWLDDIAAHGFNAIIPGCGAWRSDADADAEEPRLRAYLDAAWRRGLYSVLWIHPGGGPYPALRDGVVRTIRRLKDHPAILCWYLVDEPEGWWASQEGGKTEADLVDLLRAAREADPYRPAHINWYSWSKGKGGYGTLDATEIGSLDRYPVGRGGNAVAAVGSIARLMNDDCAPRRQPTAFWVQMYGYDDAVREPTPVEMRGMTHVCLTQGMRLIYYFIYKPMSVDLWESMAPLGAEIRALEPLLTDRDAVELARGVQDGAVHYSLWGTGRGGLCLMAVNAGDAPARPEFALRQLAPGAKVRRVRALCGEAPASYRRGKLTLRLAPNERLALALE